MGLYYGVILRNRITQSHYRIISWNYITESSLWKASRGSTESLGPPQSRPWDPGDAPGAPQGPRGPPRTTRTAMSQNKKRQRLSIVASESFRCPQDFHGPFYHVYYKNGAPFGPPLGHCGPDPCVRPLWAPWTLVGWALVGLPGHL